MKRKGFRIGRWIFTTVKQGGGAPLVDPCSVTDDDGRTYTGKAIQLTPWRRNSYGDSLSQTAFVLAVIP